MATDLIIFQTQILISETKEFIEIAGNKYKIQTFLKGYSSLYIDFYQINEWG